MPVLCFRKANTTWENIAAIVGLISLITSIVFAGGAYKSKFDSLEKGNQDFTEFKDKMSVEVSEMHTEIRMIMDHFNIPHRRNSGD